MKQAIPLKYIFTTLINYSIASLKLQRTVIRRTRRKEESERVDWDREEGGATYETESSHMSAYLPLYQKMDAEDSDFD